MEVTAPKSPLVRAVAEAIKRKHNQSFGAQAQAALDACQAEEMRQVLEILVYAKDMKKRSGDTPAYRAKKEEGWTRARAVLAELGRV